MTQDTQTPPQPQWEKRSRPHKDGWMGHVWQLWRRQSDGHWGFVAAYLREVEVDEVIDVLAKVTHLEGALREAEAKAALADDMRWALAAMLLACPVKEGGDAHRTAEELIAKHDALQQPKAGAR